MEEQIDPFMQLLTDALRAGPGSPEWHEAVARVKAGETGPGDEYALLVQARENLASGKEYRQIRAGAGFTRKLLSNIDADAQAQKKSPISASLISYIGAGLAIGALAIVLFYLTKGNDGAGSTEDLSSLFFGTSVVSASLDGPLPAGWRQIGRLAVDPARGLLPAPKGSPSEFVGGGIVTTAGMNPAEPFAVEATFNFQHVSDECVPQLFVTDDPDFNTDRATSPHELVWLVRGQTAQLALPDGKLTGSKKVVDGQSIAVRIVVGATNAMVTCDGNVLWSGVSQLASKPRYVGVRLLCRKDEKHSFVTVKDVRVLAK